MQERVRLCKALVSVDSLLSRRYAPGFLSTTTCLDLVWLSDDRMITAGGGTHAQDLDRYYNKILHHVITRPRVFGMLQYNHCTSC